MINSTECWIKEQLVYSKDGLVNGSVLDKHGNIHWFKDGMKHREDGPSIESSNGHTSYYLNNSWVNEKKYIQQVREIRLKRLLE